MNFLINNWYLIIAAIAVIIGCGYAIYKFLKNPSNEQIDKVKEWLLYAVIMAEKKFGSGTGEIKLRYVYDAFVERFSWIAKLITFEQFSNLVDEALINLEIVLKTNKQVVEIIEG